MWLLLTQQINTVSLPPDVEGCILIVFKSLITLLLTESSLKQDQFLFSINPVASMNSAAHEGMKKKYLQKYSP